MHFLLRYDFWSETPIELLLIILFFQWQPYKKYIPFFLFRSTSSKYKSKKYNFVKKGGLGHVSSSYWKNVFAPFSLTFIDIWKKNQKSFILMSFNIQNKKYIIWGQKKKLKKVGHHKVKITLFFIHIWVHFTKNSNL